MTDDEPIETRLESLVERYQSDIVRFLKFLGSTQEQALDLAQEVFLAAFEQCKKGGGLPTHSYLITSARNRFLNFIRAERNRAKREEVYAAHKVWLEDVGDNGTEGIKAILRSCMEILEPKDVDVVQSYYGSVKPRLSDVATMLRVTPSGAKKVLLRIRRKLRSCVEKRMERS